MTKKKDLKRRVRERQAKTGERYAAALAQVRKPQLTALPDVTREAETAGLRCNAVVSETLRAQGDLRSLLVRVRELLEALGASACGPLLRGEPAPREIPDATHLAVSARRFLAQARAGRRGLSPDGRLFVLQWNDVAIPEAGDGSTRAAVPGCRARPGARLRTGTSPQTRRTEERSTEAGVRTANAEAHPQRWPRPAWRRPLQAQVPEKLASSQSGAQLPFPGLLRRKRRHAGGRPPNGDRAGVPHLRREQLSRHHAVHVTLRTVNSVPGMRKQRVVSALEEAFKGARVRFGMRIVHYSVQGNHLHLLVEAEDRESLAKGMQGLAIRVAKAVNRVFRRGGQVWADRYHSHVLKTRREAANALRYILGNFSRHARQWGTAVAAFADAFSSIRFLGFASTGAPVAPPRTWLLRSGWRSDRRPSG